MSVVLHSFWGDIQVQYISHSHSEHIPIACAWISTFISVWPCFTHVGIVCDTIKLQFHSLSSGRLFAAENELHLLAILTHWRYGNCGIYSVSCVCTHVQAHNWLEAPGLLTLSYLFEWCINLSALILYFCGSFICMYEFVCRWSRLCVHARYGSACLIAA